MEPVRCATRGFQNLRRGQGGRRSRVPLGFRPRIPPGAPDGKAEVPVVRIAPKI